MAVNAQMRVTADEPGVPVFSSPTASRAAYVSKQRGEVLGATTGVTKSGRVPGQTFLEILYAAQVPGVGLVPVKGYVDDKEAITLSGGGTTGTIPEKTVVIEKSVDLEPGGEVVVASDGTKEIQLPNGRTLKIDVTGQLTGTPQSASWLPWALGGIGLLMLGVLIVVVAGRQATTSPSKPIKK